MNNKFLFGLIVIFLIALISGVCIDVVSAGVCNDDVKYTVNKPVKIGYVY